MNVIQSGHIGDLIYSLTATQKVADLFCPVRLYIGLNQRNTVSNHPSGNFCMSKESIEYIKPLLEFQSYIKEVHTGTPDHIDYDFDKFRSHGLNLAAGDLRRSHFFVYPELTTDLTTPCIKAGKPIAKYKDKILLNFTNRYRNNDINYSFLKGLDCIFFGYQSEYVTFCQRWGLDCELLEVSNALELATVIGSVKAVIGNQSSTFAIAEQMKVKRFLEVYHHAPNVIPHNNGFDYVNNEALRKLVATL